MKRLLLISATLIAVVHAMSCRSDSQKSAKTDSNEIVVAAAANLTDAFAEIGPRFTNKTGIKVVFSFGATADLAKQIENGAPFDLFAAADTEHVAQLETKGLLEPGTRAVYARGRLVMWIPPGSPLKAERIQDITAKGFERITVAKPDIAPYGKATVESLQKLGIWNTVEKKVIYAQNVSQARQYAATGNAEVAFIPLALVKPGEGGFIEVGDDLHSPIDQSLGIVAESKKKEAARQFVNFLFSEEGRELLRKRGYNTPTIQF